MAFVQVCDLSPVETVLSFMFQLDLKLSLVTVTLVFAAMPFGLGLWYSTVLYCIIVACGMFLLYSGQLNRLLYVQQPA